MTAEEILFDAEMAMEKSVEYMVHEFSSVRTGKASPALVENVDVEAYGSAMKLKQLALITTPEPRLLVVQPFAANSRSCSSRAIVCKTAGSAYAGSNPASPIAGNWAVRGALAPLLGPTSYRQQKARIGAQR